MTRLRLWWLTNRDDPIFWLMVTMAVICILLGGSNIMLAFELRAPPDRYCLPSRLHGSICAKT